MGPIVVAAIGLLVTAKLAYERSTLSITEMKGESNEGYLAIRLVVLYCVMLLGMFGHEVYARFSDKKRVRTRGEWLKPLLVSPVTFVPLIDIVDNMPREETRIRALVSMILIAYQSGFFWKQFLIADAAARSKAGKERISNEA